MRKTTITLACLLALSGCETDHEKMMDALEKQIQKTIQTDWNDHIPLADLFTANDSCRKFPVLKGCVVVHVQMQDIATSLASCHADPRSSLCQTVVNIFDPIANELPPAKPVQLPMVPWYGHMPTAFLDALAGPFGYRTQAATWWWKSWHITLLSCLVALSTILAAWFWWFQSQKKKQKLEQLLAIERERRMEQENIRRERQEQARIAAERQSRMEGEAIKAEQERLAEIEAAEAQAEVERARLEAEQAEAAALMDAIFNPDSREEHDAPTE